jgi:hypothetical protein
MQLHDETKPPTNTQYSLPGARYGLPGPVFHRQDHASFAWRTGKQLHSAASDCRVAIAPNRSSQ